MQPNAAFTGVNAPVQCKLTHGILMLLLTIDQTKVVLTSKKRINRGNYLKNTSNETSIVDIYLSSTIKLRYNYLYFFLFSKVINKPFEL